MAPFSFPSSSRRETMFSFPRRGGGSPGGDKGGGKGGGGGGGKGGGKGGGGGGGGTADLGWAVIDMTGTMTLLNSKNVASIVDDGVGLVTINWQNAFTSANYVVGTMGRVDTLGTAATNLAGVVSIAGQPAVASLKIVTTNQNNTTAVDQDVLCVYAGRHGNAWLIYNSTPTIIDDLNVASIVDGPTQQVTVNWEPDFANGNYALAGVGRYGTLSENFIPFHGMEHIASNPAAATVDIHSNTQNADGASSFEFHSLIAVSDTTSGADVSKWVVYDASSGTPTIGANLGVSSLTDNAVGDVTINWTTAFPDANYVLMGTVKRANSASSQAWMSIFSTAGNPAAGSVRIITLTNDGYVLVDPVYVAVMATIK